jgi:hypothetical protein
MSLSHALPLPAVVHSTAICVLILLYMCPHTAMHLFSYCSMCPLTVIYVSSYCCLCVLILLYMCPLIAFHVSSYSCICVPSYRHITLSFVSSFPFLHKSYHVFFFISVKSLYVLAALNKTSQTHDLTGHVERD